MSKPSKADRERIHEHSRARLADKLECSPEHVWQTAAGVWWWRDPVQGPIYVPQKKLKEVGCG